MEGNLTAWMDQLTTEYEDLETSRSTTLEIIGRSSSERDWQAMLAYFLDPSESHDMGTTFLEAFVEVIADHPETTATGLTDHLDTVIVETEVSTPPSGYADLLIWAQEEWFICIEMKVEAEETGNQTERYATTPSLGPLVKASHEARGGESQYVYLAPHYASPPKQDDEFAKVSWGEIISALEGQISTNDENSQSQAQLSGFLQTIKKYLTMDEYNKISEEAQLYAKNKSTVESIQSAYDEEIVLLKNTMEEALQADFNSGEWKIEQSSGNSRWVKLYKSQWSDFSVDIEYEPQFKLDANPPQISLGIDIQRGQESQREVIKESLINRLEESVLEEMGWAITEKDMAFLLKVIPLDVTSPQASIDETVQAIQSFDTTLGHHIDAVVEEHSTD
jgi:hypothetical protein